MDIFEKRIRHEELVKEANKLAEEIGNVVRRCNHTFGEPENDSYTTREAIPGTQRLDRENSRGSDPVFKCSYGDVTKKRWKKTCTKCGFVIRTEKTRPTGQIADFGKRRR
jgi:hypothetical protein